MEAMEPTKNAREKRGIPNSTKNNKRNLLSLQLAEMEENFKKNNTTLFHKAFEGRMKGFRPRGLALRRRDSTLALTDEKNCVILANYFEKLLNCE
ncbi:unnamed protein product [Nezara viridula]|uniref:Uncharacterized protein n=1 Tax=Nezara viridula TaxID=85310 RepID=A0A9P0HHL6_NEZVI|nr:unnamed protein product [Nezara viridula]